MDPDDFQKAWHSQSSQTRVTISADLLRKEVQRSERNFRATIFRRDFREVAVGLIMLPLWFYLGHQGSLPSTWWLGIPAITWVILFIVVDRFRHRQRPSEPGEPLVDSVKASLATTEHQIWLLRNVFWWYLLPFTIAIMAFFVQTAWLRHSGFWPFLFALAPLVLFLFALYGFVYWLNQRAVRTDLEPRREELLTLLATLGEEADGVSERPLSTDRPSTGQTGVWGQTLLVTVLAAVAVALMFLADSFVPHSKFQSFPSNRGTPAPFAKLITDLRREKKLVGLAATVTVDGKLVASAIDGERKKDSGVPLELGDQWHLGGITVSITSTMIARLIESGQPDQPGQLQWSTTVGECFPDAPIHADWKSVTFAELLTHTSGAPPIFAPEIQDKTPAPGPARTRARRDEVLKVLANKPDNPPGEQYAYSNVGTTIAAAMVEQKTGVSWEDLVTREVFQPLALNTAGFGPPTSPDETLPQPRGHRPYLGVKLPATDQDDNSPIMGPSGSVHMSLADLSTYAADHLRGHLGHGQLLAAESYQRLHTPRLHQYAYGWGVLTPTERTPYTIYWHNGSNTLWYALVVFIPERNMVVAVTANEGDITTAEEVAWQIVDYAANDYPKLSPFTAIRWQDTQPEVQFASAQFPPAQGNDEWFKLLSINDLPTADIVAFSQNTFGDKWQKRFEEDLVELLSRMGHPPQDKVTLVIETLTAPPETRTLKDIPLTTANRRAIRDAAHSRSSPQP
jgi:CubicO group peptidase (beta-lactamase class C family)